MTVKETYAARQGAVTRHRPDRQRTHVEANTQTESHIEANTQTESHIEANTQSHIEANTQTESYIEPYRGREHT